MSAHAPSSPHERVAARAALASHGRPVPRVRGDTIVAPATPPGRSAIAVVRLSGPDAERFAARVVEPRGGWPVRGRAVTRCWLHRTDQPDAHLDDGLVTVFPAPASYTGETVIELGLHGGSYLRDAVIAALIEAGARMAEPGEFTERAVLNGKLDLIRAEAIGDLIDARSGASHRLAMLQLSGALTARFVALRDAVLSLEALLAYDIDFPEEDDGRLPRARVANEARVLSEQLAQLLATEPAAVLGRDGMLVVLAGAPNAGKSSLFNALLGERRVIVSETPGTTRDAVETMIEYEPWPIRLVDTAGLREGHDAIERAGVETSERFISQAHVVVACAEHDDELLPLMEAIARRTRGRVVGARTKVDLTAPSAPLPETTVAVSAMRGEGLSELLACVAAASLALVPTAAAATVITRTRHRLALQIARDELQRFEEVWRAMELPAPVAAVHVRAAAAALDELIGAVDVDDVFARVFATFCVGK